MSIPGYVDDLPYHILLPDMATDSGTVPNAISCVDKVHYSNQTLYKTLSANPKKQKKKSLLEHTLLEHTSDRNSTSTTAC